MIKKYFFVFKKIYKASSLKIIDVKIGKTNEKLKNKINTLKRFNIDLGFIIVF